MPEIRELSKSMINKIAAGEVVERPANVVKELVENSVDAGAKRIEIVVEKSGSDLIKIVDNGCGIAAEQLVLALSPHSTSKVSEADDLFRIHTLGFRGEALASIAEVSQLVLSSRTADAEAGAQIRSDGGVFDEIVPCGRPVGTTVEARNLFFNVPARRKFLKSPTTEFGHISEAVVRIALPRPDVHFILKHNGRTVYDLPATGDRKERIGRVFGSDVAKRLVEIESEYKNVKVPPRPRLCRKSGCSGSTTIPRWALLNQASLLEATEKEMSENKERLGFHFLKTLPLSSWKNP